jgi:hypothetical protein
MSNLCSVYHICVRAVWGGGELRMDMETDITTDRACQNVRSIKKQNCKSFYYYVKLRAVNCELECES